MKEECINRSYLETLSFSDLIILADKYGIDVPENLDRRFLISEILEIVEEFNNSDDDMTISSEVVVHDEIVLPKNYNETQVSCVLRNPAWLFVYWNISEADSKAIKSNPGHVLKLRICSMAAMDDLKPEEAFEIQCSTTGQEQYVLLPQGKKFIKVELINCTIGTIDVMAFSPVIEIPQVLNVEENLMSGIDEKYSEIEKLSGIKEILMKQYSKHRQSF